MTMVVGLKILAEEDETEIDLQLSKLGGFLLFFGIIVREYSSSG